jgi:hypothetical protein
MNYNDHFNSNQCLRHTLTIAGVCVVALVVAKMALPYSRYSHRRLPGSSMSNVHCKSSKIEPLPLVVASPSSTVALQMQQQHTV